jgi:hypothetical protein
MKSIFSALFNYAKAEQSFARENFTTEALAGAIRFDHAPFLRWLVEQDLADTTSTFVSVETQCHEVEGILDLVVSLGPPGCDARVMFEIKVDAGESGDQLTRYDKRAARFRDERIACRGAVVLGRHALDDEHKLVTWHALRRFLVGQHPVIGGLWPHFAQYLTEISVADDWDMAITNTEPSALDPAYRLARKMVRVVHSSLEELRSAAGNSAALANSCPIVAGPGKSSVLGQMEDRLMRFGHIAVYPHRGGQRVWPSVLLGAWSESGAAQQADSQETRVGVWIETKPTQRDLRHQVLNHPALAALERDNWRREPPTGSDWRLLSSSESLLTLCDARTSDDNEAIRAYLVGRIQALDQSGMLRFILDKWQYNTTDSVVASDETTDSVVASGGVPL